MWALALVTYVLRVPKRVSLFLSLKHVFHTPLPAIDVVSST